MIKVKQVKIMKDNRLEWSMSGSRKLLATPIFDVLAQDETSATGINGEYIAMDAPDWVMVIAEYKGRFVTVRQWRHAAMKLSVEFPGGVANRGEDPAEAARRELFEETGFKAERLIHHGTVNPNPALFKNLFHVYYALDPQPTGQQELDSDELLTYELRAADEVIDSFGTGEYCHGLMGAAVAFYLRYKSKENRS